MLESSTLRHFEVLDCGHSFYSQLSGKSLPLFYPEAKDYKLGQSFASSFPWALCSPKAFFLFFYSFFSKREVVNFFVIVHTAFYFFLYFIVRKHS